MRPEYTLIAGEASRLAGKLPAPALLCLADAISNCHTSDWQATRSRILDCVPHHLYRTLTAAFLDRWQEHAGQVPPETVAMSLLTAARMADGGPAAQSVELVWTGPDVEVIPIRHTEQALLELLDSAERRLVLMSYAVYRIPRICQALLRAADRGCSIDVLLETSDHREGEKAYDTLIAIGPAVASRARILIWPTEARLADAKGRTGLMHVKAAVADGRRLLLTSANLTEYAFTTNMELGMMVTGGGLPDQVERHFDRMVEVGVLVPLTAA